MLNILSSRLLVKSPVTSCSKFTISLLVRQQSNNSAPIASNTTPIPQPNFDGQTKQYTQKIQNLVQEITKLNLTEVADLNELLRKTLNIKDIPVYSGLPAGMAQNEAKQKAEEDLATDSAQMQAPQKTIFKLKIVKFDETKKVALIKEIKTLGENMNLVQAKKFVDSVPQIFKEKLLKDEAEKLKETLEKAGAVVELE
jgi:large subunit ribosomal protein L7/L12